MKTSNFNSISSKLSQPCHLYNHLTGYKLTLTNYFFTMPTFAKIVIAMCIGAARPLLYPPFYPSHHQSPSLTKNITWTFNTGASIHMLDDATCFESAVAEHVLNRIKICWWIAQVYDFCSPKYLTPRTCRCVEEKSLLGDRFSHYTKRWIHKSYDSTA